MDNIIFFSHQRQIDYFAKVSHHLRANHGLRTTLWVMGKYDAMRGVNADAFTQVIDLLPGKSKLRVSRDQHLANLEWARKIENRLGSVFLRKDLTQDRYFMGRPSTDIKYSDLPHWWTERRLYAFLRDISENIEARLSENSIDLIWVEMNSAPYRLTRRLAQEYSIPVIDWADARVWENRGYFARGLDLEWEKCRNTYRRYEEKGVPNEELSKSKQRLKDIRQSKNKDRPQGNDTINSALFRGSVTHQGIIDYFKEWWRHIREPWYNNPRHPPYNVTSPMGRVKRLFRRMRSSIYFENASTTEIDHRNKCASYFLHVQPERTVESLAFEYQDQVSTIRNINAQLPSDVHLYVKEHGPMAGYRLKESYAELSHMPGVTLVHNTVSSHELIRKSICVFTLTGTVGLESLMYNTPSIILGNIFYSAFDGAFKVDDFNEIPRIIDKIQEYKVTDEKNALLALAATYTASRPMSWPPDDNGSNIEKLCHAVLDAPRECAPYT